MDSVEVLFATRCRWMSPDCIFSYPAPRKTLPVAFSLGPVPCERGCPTLMFFSPVKLLGFSYARTTNKHKILNAILTSAALEIIRGL